MTGIKSRISVYLNTNEIMRRCISKQHQKNSIIQVNVNDVLCSHLSLFSAAPLYLRFYAWVWAWIRSKISKQTMRSAKREKERFRASQKNCPRQRKPFVWLVIFSEGQTFDLWCRGLLRLPLTWWQYFLHLVSRSWCGNGPVTSHEAKIYIVH